MPGSSSSRRMNERPKLTAWKSQKADGWRAGVVTASEQRAAPVGGGLLPMPRRSRLERSHATSVADSKLVDELSSSLPPAVPQSSRLAASNRMPLSRHRSEAEVTGNSLTAGDDHDHHQRERQVQLITSEIRTRASCLPRTAAANKRQSRRTTPSASGTHHLPRIDLSAPAISLSGLPVHRALAQKHLQPACAGERAQMTGKGDTPRGDPAPAQLPAKMPARDQETSLSHRLLGSSLPPENGCVSVASSYGADVESALSGHESHCDTTSSKAPAKKSVDGRTAPEATTAAIRLPGVPGVLTMSPRRSTRHQRSRPRDRDRTRPGNVHDGRDGGAADRTEARKLLLATRTTSSSRRLAASGLASGISPVAVAASKWSLATQGDVRLQRVDTFDADDASRHRHHHHFHLPPHRNAAVQRQTSDPIRNVAPPDHVSSPLSRGASNASASSRKTQSTQAGGRKPSTVVLSPLPGSYRHARPSPAIGQATVMSRHIATAAATATTTTTRVASARRVATPIAITAPGRGAAAMLDHCWTTSPAAEAAGELTSKQQGRREAGTAVNNDKENVGNGGTRNKRLVVFKGTQGRAPFSTARRTRQHNSNRAKLLEADASDDGNTVDVELLSEGPYDDDDGNGDIDEDQMPTPPRRCAVNASDGAAIGLSACRQPLQPFRGNPYARRRLFRAQSTSSVPQSSAAEGQAFDSHPSTDLSSDGDEGTAGHALTSRRARKGQAPQNGSGAAATSALAVSHRRRRARRPKNSAFVAQYSSSGGIAMESCESEGSGMRSPVAGGHPGVCSTATKSGGQAAASTSLESLDVLLLGEGVC